MTFANQTKIDEMFPTKSTSRRRWLILCICCLSILLVALDLTIVNVALPSLQHDFNTDVTGAQWTIDGYTLVLASLLLFGGSLGDKIGRRRVFQTGLVIFALGSLLCSMAPNIGWLIVFRMMQAVGGSMLNPVALSIINNTFTDTKERAKAIGVWGGVVGIGSAVGPIIGGILVSTVGWRSIFWINIPIAIIALVLTAVFVPESRTPKPRRFDPVGQVLVIGMLSSLIYGIIEAPTHGWGSPLIVACFVAAFVFFIGIIWYEQRRFEPLINLHFFRSPPFSGAAVIAICTLLGLSGFLFLNTLYLQDVHGFSAIRSGLYLLPMAAAMFVFSLLSGRIVGSRGPRIPLTIGGILVTVAALMFAIVGSQLGELVLFTGYALIGAGIGFLNAAITNTALSGMPRSQAGVAAATTSTSRQIGQSLGVAIIGSVLASGAVKVTSGSAFDHDWTICWLVLCGVGVLIIVTTNVTTGKWALQTAEKNRKLIEAEEAKGNPW